MKWKKETLKDFHNACVAYEIGVDILDSRRRQEREKDGPSFHSRWSRTLRAIHVSSGLAGGGGHDDDDDGDAGKESQPPG